MRSGPVLAVVEQCGVSRSKKKPRFFFMLICTWHSCSQRRAAPQVLVRMGVGLKYVRSRSISFSLPLDIEDDAALSLGRSTEVRRHHNSAQTPTGSKLHARNELT